MQQQPHQHHHRHQRSASRVCVTPRRRELLPQRDRALHRVSLRRLLLHRSAVRDCPGPGRAGRPHQLLHHVQRRRALLPPPRRPGHPVLQRRGRGGLGTRAAGGRRELRLRGHPVPGAVGRVRGRRVRGTVPAVRGPPAVLGADGEPGHGVQQRRDPRLHQLPVLPAHSPLQLRGHPVRDGVQLRDDGVRDGLLHGVRRRLLHGARQAAQQLQVQGQGLRAGHLLRLHPSQHAVLLLQPHLRERGRLSQRLLLYRPLRHLLRLARQRHLRSRRLPVS